jgi:membrane-associated phospholipid phosphatase
MIAEFNSWIAAFGKEVPVLLWYWLAAWAWSYVLLVVLISLFRRPLSTLISHFDGKVQRLAHRWRYQGLQTQAEQLVERAMLTWFFRFWTNFASAPSLIFFSFAVPIVIYMNAPSSSSLFRGTGVWLLPGLCYGGGMLLSFWLKRVFKRVRPERQKGAFGHKLRDHSFPSGHSLTSFCFWIMCIGSFAAGHNGLVVWFFGFMAALIVLLTGMSRIYLAVHWPSDVLGGYCIGTLWTLVCYVVLFHQVVRI